MAYFAISTGSFVRALNRNGMMMSVFTSSGQTATAIGDALESGMVAINNVVISTPETPFGGVKESGYGHEGGIEGLEAYTVKKFIAQA